MRRDRAVAVAINSSGSNCCRRKAQLGETAGSHSPILAPGEFAGRNRLPAHVRARTSPPQRLPGSCSVKLTLSVFVFVGHATIFLTALPLITRVPSTFAWLFTLFLSFTCPVSHLPSLTPL